MNSVEGDTSVSKLSAWVSLGKNFVWIIGLIVVALYKFQEQENINLNQDIQLRAIREEYRYYNTRAEKLDDELHSIRLEVTTLKTKQESEQRMNREYRR